METRDLDAGWVTWDGGERPVDLDSLVIVRFCYKNQESRGWKRAGGFYWHKSQTHPGGDIIAYRAPPPTVKGQ